MRVGILAPKYYPAQSGNAVTVRRIEGHLRRLGCEVQVFPVDQLSGEQLLAGVKSFEPELLHAFHGFHGGRMAHAVAETVGVPYLVTLTGTDVYQALSDHRMLEVRTALKGGARLVAFHACVKHRLAEHLPSLEERTVIIPQGVELPAVPGEGTGCSPDEACTFLLPAGIRPVKNLLFPLQPLAQLNATRPLRLLLVGPVLDPAYAAELMEALEQYPFVSYLGAVGHDAMGQLYRAADVVLNTSLFEGGMANCVLEALAHGKAVLATDIEGNRSLVKEPVTGMLYRDAAEFLAKAEQLVNDPQLRARLGQNGRSLVKEKYPPEKEAAAYLALYKDIIDN